MSDSKDAGVIPPHVRRFLILNVASVPHMEAMLLLCEHESRRWDTAAVARRLYMSEEAAGALLSDLLARGIVAADEHDGKLQYHYQPATPELRQTVRDAAVCYAKNLRLVTHLIHSRTASQAQQFADAFKLRKDP